MSTAGAPHTLAPYEARKQHMRRRSNPPRSILCLCALAVVIPLGLAVRYAPLHLPRFWSKYLGSALWAMAVYWLCGALLPRLKPLALAFIASTIAIAVELSRLFPEPHIDAFRLTLAGRLLLGRYFAWPNILAYLIGIAITALADGQLRRNDSNINNR